jgi:hypothetical protein
VAFIGPEEHEDVEAGRCLGGGSGVCFNVSVTGVEGSLEEGKQRGEMLPEGEEEEASSSRW